MQRWICTLGLLLACGAASASEPAKIRVDKIQRLYFLPDGQSVVGYCRHCSLVLYDLTGRIVAGHEQIAYEIWALAVDPQGRRIATAERVLKGKAADSGTASRIRFWSVPELKVERTIDLDKFELPTALAFSPDGKTLASSQSEAGVALWDVKSGQKKHAWADKGRDINTLIFCEDGKRLTCAGNAAQVVENAVTFMGSDRVVVLDAETGKIIEKLNINASWLVTSDDRRWLYHQGSWLQKVPAGRGALTADGEKYAWRHEVGLIDRFNGRTVYRSETGPGPVVIAARGSFMAYVTKDPVESMSAAERAKLKGPRPPWKHLRVAELRTGQDIWQRADPDVTAKALSPDGRRLAIARGPTVKMQSAGQSATVEVFDLLREARSTEELMGVAAAWKELADPKGEKLLEAYRSLRADPDATLRFLRKEVRPATLDGKLLARRIDELSDPQFAVRERAGAELIKLDAEGWLQKAVMKPASAEQGQRMERLLEWFSAQPLQSDRLPVARALDLMTFLPPEKAALYLAELVKEGPPEAWLTREARAARQKLGR